MDDILKILNQIYGKGFTFVKEVEIPVIHRKANLSITITAKGPTKFSFTQNAVGGTLTFDPGIQVHIPKVFIDTTLKSIELDIVKGVATVHCNGCPAIPIDLKELK